MPTTTNNGWTTPADTDLVRQGANAIRTLAGGIDTTVGAWTAWTPTIGQEGGTGAWALGNGTIVARYQRIADVVNFELKFALGNTSTKGTGGITFSLPISANSAVDPNFGSGTFFDDSATNFYPVMWKISSNIVKPFIISTTLSSITSTVPVVPTTNDYIVVNGSYAV